jgi:Arc/MetJ-type ribon-helix-helix transcriptional regulator
MRNITIALPEIYVRNIEKVQNLGMIPSRSEGIRSAVKKFLIKEGLNLALLGGLD